MLILALVFLVVLTSPASAEPVSLWVLGALAIEATKTAIAITTFIISAVAYAGVSLIQSKLFSAKPKKTTPSNIDSSLNVTVKESLAPRRVVYGRTRLGGTIVFLGSTENNLYLHLVIVLCEGEIDAIETVYFNDVALTIDPATGHVLTGPYNSNNYPYALVWPHLGAPDQAADSFMLANFPSQWTADHRLQGCAYLYVRLQWDATVYASGLPNVSAVVRGQKVYDPRTGLITWSDNAALCIRDYLLRPFAKGGMGADPAEIDEDNFVAQANICDETILKTDGTQERRYTLNGVLQMDSQNSPQGTIESMLTSCAGTMTWTGGIFYLFAGAWRPPTLTLTEDWLTGPLKIQPRRLLREQFNAVKGSFVNPAARYEAADYPAITSPTFEAEDGDVQIFRDLTLEFTQSAAMAQRIAKIELYRSREPISISAVCNLFAYQLAVGDVVSVTLGRYGWDEKPFEVTNWRWSASEVDNVPVLAIELTLRETSAAVYDWTATEEQLLAAQPATNLPNWTVVGGVLSLSLAAGTNELLLAGDGTVVSRIKATWTASVDAFVSKYEVRWKRNTDANFGVAVTVGVDAAPVHFISPVEDGSIYVVEVRALSLLGATSSWISGTVTVLGKTEVPPDVAAVRIAGGVLTWDYPNPPADLAGFKVRYHVGSYTFWASGTDAHSGLLSSGQFDASTLVSGTVTFMVKAIDTSGNESENAAAVIVNLGDYVTDNVVFDYDLKAAGFPGTITSGEISGGNLVGVSTGLFWPSNDNAQFWPSNDNALFWPDDTFSDVVWEFSYTPGEALAGSTMSISSAIVGAPYTIAYRESGQSLFWPADDAALFWPADDSALFWPPDGEMQSWPGTVTAKATRYDFRVTVSGGAVQPVISEFDLIFDVPDLVEVLGNVAISAAGTALPLTKPFRAITVVNLTVQATAGGAVTARIESKSPGAVVVTVRNAAGTAVDGVLDAIVQGF